MTGLEHKIMLVQFGLGDLSGAEPVPENDWLQIALACGPAERKEIEEYITAFEGSLIDGVQRDAETLVGIHEQLYFFRTLLRIIDEESRLIAEDQLWSLIDDRQR